MNLIKNLILLTIMIIIVGQMGKESKNDNESATVKKQTRNTIIKTKGVYNDDAKRSGLQSNHGCTGRRISDY